MLSLVIPVYKNEASLDRLLKALTELKRNLCVGFEVVWVIDGSPDRSLEILRQRLGGMHFPSRIVVLSRNFGAFNAIAAGLRQGSGDYFAVMAADVQEPPELVIEFARTLHDNEADIVFGTRERRSDPWLSDVASRLFWTIYRKFVVRDMPRGGVDIFGCTRTIRDHVVSFPESNTNIIALLFWLGFRRRFITYERAARREGESAWTVMKKVRYAVDSIFSFTDLPIQVLLSAGVVGITVASIFGAVLLVARLLRQIPVPGYTAIVLSVVFFGGLTSLGLGIVGQYLWLTLQNARRRPNYVIAETEEVPGSRR
ncbi:MAG: glycosyltransferase family 2 protein [Acidobacteria bacterium]|nr:glycosyltransferase family 2 protein [Acidobacteriota bacterium]